MKTVFKVGMKVYDQVNFPKKEGVVIKIDNFPCPIIVEFGGDKYCYRLDGSFQLGAKPTLSTKPYIVDFQGFEQESSTLNFDKIWKEAKKVYKPQIEYYIAYPSQELANAAEALRRLLFLRDYYNEGWQPDWGDIDSIKFSIMNSRYEIDKAEGYFVQKVMAFKDKEVRDKFLEEQKELLEIAKPLL